MPYIGKSPTGSGVRTRYYFTATGGETSLSGADDGGKTLTFSDGEYVDVYLNGIALVAGTDYGTATANTISGLAALSTDDIVEVVVYDIYNVAKINSEAVRTRHYYTATGGETSIGTAQIPGLSFPGGTEIEVSLNGISLVAGTDYNTTAANTVGGLSPLSAGNVIEIIIYDKFQLADTVSKAQGGTFSGPVTFSNAVKSSNGIYLGGTASTNLLDNYVNDGTWSPYFSDINGNAIFNESPTVTIGNYQRIGDFVTLHTYFGNPSSVTTTASYSAGGQAYVGGLPFAVPSGAYYAGNISYQVGLAGYDSGNVSIALSCIAEGGYSVLRLHYAIGGTMAGATQNMFAGSTALILAITYKVV